MSDYSKSPNSHIDTEENSPHAKLRNNAGQMSIYQTPLPLCDYSKSKPTQHPLHHAAYYRHQAPYNLNVPKPATSTKPSESFHPSILKTLPAPVGVAVDEPVAVLEAVRLDIFEPILDSMLEIGESVSAVTEPVADANAAHGSKPVAAGSPLRKVAAAMGIQSIQLAKKIELEDLTSSIQTVRSVLRIAA